MTASICSNRASIGVICLSLLEEAEVDDIVVGDEYSRIRLSPACFNALPFSRHIAAIRLNRSLVHLMLPLPNAIASGEGADIGCCCCWCCMDEAADECTLVLA